MTEPEHFFTSLESGVSIEAMLAFATQARLGLFVWDDALRLVGYNARVCDVLGMPTDSFQPGRSYNETIEQIEKVGRETWPGMIWPARLPLRDFTHARELLATEGNSFATLPGRNDVGVKVKRMILDDRWMLSVLSDMRDIEEQHQENEREKIYLDVTFENMVDGVVLVNRNGKIDACNQSMLKMHGMDPAKYHSGIDFDRFVTLNQGFDALSAKARQDVVDLAHQLINGRAFAEGRHTRRIRQLSGRVFEYSRRKLPSDSVVLSVRDVTEGYELEQQRLYFETILDNISDGAMMLDADNRVVACNRRFLEHYGVEPSAYWQGMPVSDFARLHGDLALAAPEDRERILRERSEFGSGMNSPKNISTVERRMLNGETLQVTRNVLPNGCAVITVRNTTEAVQLSRQRQMFKTVIDNISDGVTLMDASGHYAVINDRMLELYEIDPETARTCSHVESFARACGDLEGLTNEEVEREVQSRIAFATDPNPGKSSLVRELRDGRKLTVVRRVLDDGSAVATYRDITQDSRTRALLEDARKSAEEANRLKSDFMAKVTHDLRTPMHGVLGMAELLRNSGLSAEQMHMLDMLRKSGEHMVALIDGLLTLSTLESGQLELRSEPTDLRDLIRNCVEIMSPHVREKDLDMIVKDNLLGGSSVLGDGTRIMQILLNLLGNAVKFTDAGSVTLASRSILKGGFLSLTLIVSDTGPGMPADKLNDIFQKFQQLDGNRSAKRAGVGLGLAIARSLAEQMGGRLTVRSELGSGTEFTLKLNLPANDQGLTSLSA